MSPAPSPPRVAEALIGRLAPGRSARYLVADLGEEYHELRRRRPAAVAHLWYWSQTLRIAIFLLLHRVRGGSPVLPRPERTGMLDSIRQDLRFSFRSLLGNPAFTLVAVAALAVGIGTNTAIFSVVYGVLQSLPYPGGERVVLVYEGDARERTTGMLSPPEVEALDRLEGDVFEVAAAYRYGSVVLDGDPNPEQVGAPAVTPDFLRLVDESPHLGRAFEPDVGPDTREIYLGYELWQRLYGGDREVVGETIRVNGEPYTVIGVSSPAFTYFNDTDRLFRPLVFGPAELGDSSRHSVYSLARLREGLSAAEVDGAVADVVAIAQRATGHSTERPYDVWLHPLYEAWVGQVRAPLLILMGAVGLLVLIACSNVASLQLARGLGRGREIAIRLAVGAGRARIVRQLITESALLALLGGGVALLVVWQTVGWLRGLVQAQLPRTENIELDLWVLGFTGALSLLAGLASGVAPAWIATRGDLSRPLAEGGPGATGGRTGQRLRSGLLVVQVALAVVLTVGAGLLVRSFGEIQTRELGYEPEDVMTATFFLGARPEYRDPGRVREFADRLIERVASWPEVESTGVISLPPGLAFQVAGQFVAEEAEAAPQVARPAVVTPEAMETLRIELVAGRSLGSADTADAPAVMLVNQALARRLWPEGDAVGRRLRSTRPESPWLTVVGVVGNTRDNALSDPDIPRLYQPLSQQSQLFLTLVTRLSGPALDFAERLRAAVAEIDPGQPVGGPASLEETLAGSIASERMNMSLVSLFAVLALALAAAGEYAVIQYLVVQRRGEIGIRMALGADRGRVVSLVLRHGVLYAALGVAVGLAGAWAASRLLVNLVHEVEPTDPWIYAAVAALLLGVAVGASLLPARRATRIDPVDTLRRA